MSFMIPVDVFSYIQPPGLLWIVIVGAFLAFTMGFATGANDVANAFSTSVGSGALTLRNALVAASIFELLGAVALGSRVAGTIKNGIVDTACFENDKGLYMLGMTCALFSSTAWICLASYLGFPVSVTHSVVGSIIGMGLVLKGFGCVKWSYDGLTQIFVSWFTSPFISGILAFLIYWTISKFIFSGNSPIKLTLFIVPVLFSLSLFFVEYTFIFEINIPNWSQYLILLLVPLVVYIMSVIFFVPWMRRKATNYFPPGTQLLFQPQENYLNESVTVLDGVELNKQTESNVVSAIDSQPTENTPFDLSNSTAALKQSEVCTLQQPEICLIDSTTLKRMQATQVFWWVQIFSSCFASFAHGANDTSNAVGPFAAIYFMYRENEFSTESIPLWTSFLGGVSIVIGLSVLGHKVIKTVGKSLLRINYMNGFASELSTSITVVLASKLKIPVSSTHCLVGAVTFTGFVNTDEYAYMKKSTIKSRLKNVNWTLILKILASWVITLPVSALVSGIMAFVLKYAIKT